MPLSSPLPPQQEQQQPPLQPANQVENNSLQFPISFAEMQVLLSLRHSTGDNIELYRPESSIATANEMISCFPETTQSDNITSLLLGYVETYKRLSPRRQAMIKMELASLFGHAEINELDAQPVTVLSPTDSGIIFDESNNSLYKTKRLYTDLLPVYNNSNQLIDQYANT
jgi:hypothetical protein